MMVRAVIEISLCLLCAISVAYWMLSAFWLRRRMSRPRASLPAPLTLEAVAFLRPIKAGVPDLPARLREAVECMRPGDQIIFGVDAGSPEAALCAQVCGQFQGPQILIVPCRPGPARNPKINKLLQMSASATAPRLIVMDCEAMPDAEWMQRFRAEWEGTGVDLLTAGYRFARADRWWQQLDALPVLLTLWPGLATVEATGSLRFALGACIALRRDALAALGGWGRWADELAEDHALGQSFAAAGHRVGLSREVLTLHSEPLDATAYWRHQRRAAVTYRVANPAGYAGQLITHGITFALFLLVASGGAAWAWIVASLVCLARILTAHQASHALRWLCPRLWLLAPLASILETVFWAAAWISPVVFWAGRWWQVSSAGRLKELHRPDR